MQRLGNRSNYLNIHHSSTDHVNGLTSYTGISHELHFDLGLDHSSIVQHGMLGLHF